MNENTGCGIFGIYPKWLRGFATTKYFIIVYGFLGTVQSMAFIYMTVILTTLEKRFKIPSRTTGIILSGNEISQILSILLTYYGGSGHRPRWIAIGVACSALSCLVLALPHVIYGPGHDAMSLTKEYLDKNLLNATIPKKDISICSAHGSPEQCDAQLLSDTSFIPGLLVFLSQFILGIGTTLYYGLGQTYMDDNTKKKNTPILLGATFALRTVGPAIGFLLSYACLNLYIDPTLHPVIDRHDPRWLGAWWLGWIILGIAKSIFALLLGLFPRELQKSKSSNKKPAKLEEGEFPLKIAPVTQEKLPKTMVEHEKKEPETMPTLKEFPAALKRILTNKLLMCNIVGGVFFILSTSGYWSFMSKYLEVQYDMTAGGGTIVTGPISLLGMILGFLISGAVIGKFKPASRTLLAWNVIVGTVQVIGQFSYIYFGCDGLNSIQGVNFDTMSLNLSSTCNSMCNCEDVKYSPVCHEASKTTFFSACHAGCSTILNDTIFANCSCVADGKLIDLKHDLIDFHSISDSLRLDEEVYSVPVIYDNVKAGPCQSDCMSAYLTFTIVTSMVYILGCSGKIGNVLVNYRSVEVRDKSFAQGVSLMIVSLFALIPGPIIFGAIMDSTCLVWDETCGMKGNCWFYHRDNFRFYLNICAVGFCTIGVFFDMIVCYLGKGIDLYGENDDKRRVFIQEKEAPPMETPQNKIQLKKTAEQNSFEKNSVNS